MSEHTRPDWTPDPDADGTQLLHFRGCDGGDPCSCEPAPLSVPALKAACEDALRAAGWTQVESGDWQGAWMEPGREWPKLRRISEALDVLWKETR